MTINLKKSADTLRVSLAKKGLSVPPVVEIAYLEDVSGSYEDEHLDGTTGVLLSRILPWGIVFDPDKKMDFFTFSNGQRNAVYVGEVTETNHDGYIKKNVIGKVRGWNGGTDYSYVIRKALAHFGWIKNETSALLDRNSKRTGGIFGFLKGKKEEPVQVVEKRKCIALLNTDGENFDKSETEYLLKEMQSKGYAFYVLFLAYANGGADLSFINRMADKFENCGICKIENLRAFVALTDEQLNEKLVTTELVNWLKK